MQTNAPALYSLLTGRVSSINRSVVSDEKSKQYGAFQPIVRNHQREIGLYFQDSWRLHPRLTFNYGVRWDRQNPPVNDNGVYTRPGYAGVWGVSGVGNCLSRACSPVRFRCSMPPLRANPASARATNSSLLPSDSPGRFPTAPAPWPSSSAAAL